MDAPSRGRIIRVEPDGLIVFQDVATARVGYFTVDKVKWGRTATTPFLAEGMVVTYRADDTTAEVVQAYMVEA